MSITDPIEVKLTATRSKILINQDTTLSASEAITTFPNFKNKKGLVF